MDSQSDKASPGQRSGPIFGGGANATNILLLVLIAALLFDIWIRISPSRKVVPKSGTPAANISPPPPGRQHGSSYSKNSANQAVIEFSPENLQPEPGMKPKGIIDKISPSP